MVLHIIEERVTHEKHTQTTTDVVRLEAPAAQAAGAKRCAGKGIMTHGDQITIGGIRARIVNTRSKRHEEPLYRLRYVADPTEGLPSILGTQEWTMEELEKAQKGDK